MDFLRYLAENRTTFFDSFFSVITRFGEETIFILVGLIFFWCVNKKQGYYILSIGFLGTVINQFLKLWFRIPRPWIKDASFSPVDGSKAAATGYSFPSGHTQTAVGVYGAIARIYNNIYVRVSFVLIAVLVAFSRMYLGVHTPMDVGVSFIIATVLVFILYPIIYKATEKPKYMRIFFASMLCISLAYLMFVLLYDFPIKAESELENINHGIKNAYKILGCLIGLWLSYEVDNRFIKFETKCVWWAQIIKLVVGLIPILLIKEGLDKPLETLFNGSYLADGIRYLLMVVFAGCVWPLTFKFFSKLGKNTEK